MARPVAAEQLTLEPRNILPTGLEALPGIDPDRRITLAMLCGSLARAVSSEPAAAVVSDPGSADMASREFIEQGLYIYRDDPRYDTAEQLVLPRSRSGIQRVTRENLKLPFDLRRGQPGIVVRAEEVSQVSFSPGNLVNIVKARVRSANPDMDSEELRKKANRGAAKALREKLAKMEKLEESIVLENELLARVLRQTLHGTGRRSTVQNQFKARNLDRARRQADELVYDTLETSAINNFLTNYEKRLQKQQVRQRLYNGNFSAREIDQSWHEMCTTVGLYGNARRLTVWQIMAACRSRFAIYHPYISEEQEAAAGD